MLLFYNIHKHTYIFDYPHNDSLQEDKLLLLLLLLLLVLVLLLILFYGHYTGQPVLAGTAVKNWRILLVQSFQPVNGLFCFAAILPTAYMRNHRKQIREKMLEFSSMEEDKIKGK